MTAVTFTPRQVALMLRILVSGEGLGRLAKLTHTAAADLRWIANGTIEPTAGVLAYLDLQPCGENFTWKLETEPSKGGLRHA